MFVSATQMNLPSEFIDMISYYMRVVVTLHLWDSQSINPVYYCCIKRRRVELQCDQSSYLYIWTRQGSVQASGFISVDRRREHEIKADKEHRWRGGRPPVYGNNYVEEWMKIL